MLMNSCCMLVMSTNRALYIPRGTNFCVAHKNTFAMGEQLTFPVNYRWAYSCAS